MARTEEHQANVERRETLHRICGRLEVARSYIERSAELYLSTADTSDGRILEALGCACAYLSWTVEELQRHEPRLHVVH